MHFFSRSSFTSYRLATTAVAVAWVLCFCNVVVEATHFRFGALHWKPGKHTDTHYELLLDVHLAFR